MKIVLRIISYVLFILGSVGWLGGFVPLHWADSTFEMPLGDLEGIAVDSSGRIYCGAQFYSRIQQYDSSGRFVTGWFIDSSGGAFRIRISKNDEVEVATARNDMLYRFKPSGKLIEQKKNVHHFFSDFGSEGEKKYQGSDGSVYTALSFLFPCVIERTPSGERVKIVSTPFHKWLIMGPFPAWFFIMGAVLSRFGLRRLKRREKKNKETQPDA